MNSAISVIEMELASKILQNEELISGREGFSDQKIRDKIGVSERTVCGPGQFASDLAIGAGRKALAKFNKSDIDFLIYCTQSPDYAIPTTACMIHETLALNKTCGTIEINLGCSGWVYAIGMANSLICSRMARNVLVICADSYSKYIDDYDIPNRAIFGDGASATIVQADNGYGALFRILPFFKFGTDGSGADFLSVRTSGLKGNPSETPLFMNGLEIYNFCLREIPKLRDSLLKEASLTDYDIQKYCLHQASKTMLDALAHKMQIPTHKMIRSMEKTGNTVSSTIPIALIDSLNRKEIFSGDTIMCLGFGVGLSWAGSLIKKI